MDFNGWDPIFLAVMEGNMGEVRRRLEAEPDLMEARDSEDTEEQDRTLLMVAADHGHLHLVRLLLEMGAEVNATTFHGATALQIAALRGHEEMVSMLLSSGADSSRRDNDGFTALMVASSVNNLGTVRLLLQHMRGRGLNEHNSRDGCTALGWACIGGHVEMCRTLLLAGADHTVGSYEENPPKEWHREGYFECMALLEVSEWHARTTLAGRHAMYRGSSRACGGSS
jgi:ankyrin repeat protein